MKTPSPTDAELKAGLGSAWALWADIVGGLDERFGPLDRQWRPSKSGFGRMCLLRRRERTLLYLTPDSGKIWIAIVLGERAYGLAMASSLPGAIKTLLSDARPYAEGRGIRFSVTSSSDIPTISQLMTSKTTPA